MIKKWNDTLEKIFESNNNDLSLLESQKVFELNVDDTFLENLSYVHTAQGNATSVFSQLSPFFEIGFLLEKQKDQHLAVQGFAYGQTLNLAQKTLVLKLPRTSVFHIVKTSAFGILKKMSYEFLNSKKNMNAFVISVSPNLSILVVTALAEPWLKVRLETLQKTLMKIHFE